MKTTILSILTFVLLSGCGGDTRVEEKKSKTVLDTQINTIKDAKKKC